MYLFELYQHYTKLHTKDAHEPPGVDTYPETWKTTFIKEYPRFPSIALPAPAAPTTTLAEILTTRRSGREFTIPLTLDDLSALLFYSLGEKGKILKDDASKRMYPSAGGRFPLEFYVAIITPIDTLTAGIYHYAVATHSLTRILELPEDTIRNAPIATYEFTKKSHVAIITTALFSRSAIKYGERAYRFGLLEGGAVAQNLGLVATSLQLNSVIVGGIVDDIWEDWLDIDGTSETILYGMFFG
jgi:SagB-type dehydrogenase family enzyme